ncbi:MAG: hybrid sensor histidine kinase/response regulator [Desulfarculus sp.]|nr:MAG: hybrid sensor histidine kinase/response regulator [Desulfarculus sp.]
MNPKDAEFLKRIQAAFRVEAQEHVRTISAGLIELEKTPEPARGAELIETVFRATHSLKGAARSVDQRDIEAVCQPLESIFAALKRENIVLSPALYDLFHQAVDYIAQLVSALQGQAPPPEAAGRQELIERLGQAALGAAPASGSPAPAPPAQTPGEQTLAPPAPAEISQTLGESVRIPTAKLDPLLLQAEEMILFKMAASQRVVDLRGILDSLAAWKEELGRRRGGEGDQAGPLDGQGRLSDLQHQMEGLSSSLAEDQRAIRRMVDEHLAAMKSILMLPVSVLVDSLPRFVRNLSREQGKEAELILSGTEIEIDKRILEELKDPLIHLIRNCIDHGLQKPAGRKRQKKAPRGSIRLSFAAKDSRQVEVVISDDGEGIDLERVRAAAVNKGLVSVEAAAKLSPRQTLALIFQSGVSTSPIITDLSGRGLGLAIVREKVEKLGGVVSVDASGHEGTTFRLLLPMTLATFRGVLVRADEHLFLLPTVNVQRALRVSRQAIKTVENQQTITLDGEVISLVRLGDCLGLSARSGALRPAIAPAAHGAAASQVPVLVLASAGRRMAFQVDEVLDEQQVLLKGLGRQLSRVRNIAGAAVLSTGRVAPVLKVPDLMASALRPGAGAAAAAESEAAKTGRVLVAEDSITARTLIKNILETAGYQVATAVDGMDAFAQVRSGEFDLVVSDVDMPRMNGFELTAKIRGDRKLGELPVVLVTALESREDRERGIEVGADAYIVKSSFDQSNLLDVIRKLL